MAKSLQDKLDYVLREIGETSLVVIKNFYIGKDKPINAAAVFIGSFVDKEMLNRDVLYPLMHYSADDIGRVENGAEYICRRYISMCDTSTDSNLDMAVEGIKNQKTLILIENLEDYILVGAQGGERRPIGDALNETSYKGTRESFVESIDTNISLLIRNIKDRNLKIEYFTVGRRSQTKLAMVFIEDIVSDKVLQEARKRINAIDTDFITSGGMLEQYIEDRVFSIFPQFMSSEKPDVILANISEGRIAFVLDGASQVLIGPALFVQFFQSSEDYYSRTIAASFSRLMRLFAVFIVITFPSIYLTLVAYNVELIPIAFINPIAQFRKGIALPPFLEILAMELMIEFLREGGLRLPTKLGQTLSIVGGIIVGNAAIQSKFVSPTTILVVGLTVVASFLIADYEMSLSVRILRFPMLILANGAGLLGIAVGWYLIIIAVMSLKSLGVYCFTLSKNDFQDMFVRYPLGMMKRRPKSIPEKDIIRRGNIKGKQ